VCETIAEILESHRAEWATPEQTVARTFARIRAHADPAVFIALRDEADALRDARTLAADGKRDRALYGITAACPAFAYLPAADATAVARLKEAGAIIIGKTNLDQFATGLVGVRSPYGVPRNLFDARLIRRVQALR